MDVMQPVTLAKTEFDDSGLTPTERVIKIEREAVPKLQQYQQRIQSLCDKIESAKTGEAYHIEHSAKIEYENGAHPQIQREELYYSITNQQASNQKLIDYVSQGYTIAKQKVIGDRLVIYKIAPGVNPEDIMKELRATAAKSFKTGVESAEQELAAVRLELTRYKKSVQVALAEVPTLAELMKQVR